MTDNIIKNIAKAYSVLNEFGKKQVRNLEQKLQLNPK